MEGRLAGSEVQERGLARLDQALQDHARWRKLHPATSSLLKSGTSAPSDLLVQQRPAVRHRTLVARASPKGPIWDVVVGRSLVLGESPASSTEEPLAGTNQSDEYCLIIPQLWKWADLEHVPC